MDKAQTIAFFKNVTNAKALRLQAMFSLMGTVDDEVLSGYLSVLFSDPCEIMRHETAFILGETASRKSALALLKMLKNDQSPIVLHECLVALGIIGTKKDIARLKPFLHHPYPLVSASANIGMDRILQEDRFDKNLTKEQKKYNYLKPVLNYRSVSENMRSQYLFQLMTVGNDDQVVSTIARVLSEDPSEIVRHEAAFVLGEIASQKCLDILLQAVAREKSAVVLHEALFAIGTIGDKRALSILESFTRNNQYLISESARIAIDRINLIPKPYRGPEHFKQHSN